MHYHSYNVTPRINFGPFQAVIWPDNDLDYPRGLDFTYWNRVIFYSSI